MDNPDSVVIKTKLTDSQIFKWLGNDAFFDWIHAPEDQQLAYFLKHGAVMCGAWSADEVEAGTIPFMKMLSEKNVPYTVKNYKNEIQPHGMYFRRGIKLMHTNILNSIN